MKKILLVLILFFIIVCCSFSQDNWVNPTSHNDPDNQWFDEVLAYDGDTATRAYDSVDVDVWGSFLQFFIASILCDKLQFKVDCGTGAATIDLDAWYNDTWNHVYEGTFLRLGVIEKALGDAYTVTKVQIKLKHTKTGTYDVKIHEIWLNDITPEGWSHKWNTKEISKWNTKEILKWNDLE